VSAVAEIWAPIAETRETEIGALPANWLISNIGDITSKVGSGITPTGGRCVYLSSGRPFVRSQNVGWGTLLLDDLAFISDETHNTFASTELREGDVLLNITGASIGRCAIADANLSGGNVNQHVCIIRVDHAATDAQFVRYVLLSQIGQRQIDSFQAGGNREGLNFVQVRSILCPIPSKLEQHAIATALSDTDGLIEALESLIAKKRAVKQGAMQELLSGRIRLPGFSGEWHEKVIGEVASIDPENLGAQTPHDYAFNYIALEDVNVGSLVGYSERVLQTAPSRARRKLQYDDVLVATVRPNLKSHLLFKIEQGEWVCSTGFSVIRCYPGKAAPGFIFAHLFGEIIARQIDALISGSNYPAINSRDVAALRIPIPPVDEQIAIAATLSDMDEELAALETRLAKARAIKQGMMQELLTGKIRLI